MNHMIAIPPLVRIVDAAASIGSAGLSTERRSVSLISDCFVCTTVERGPDDDRYTIDVLAFFNARETLFAVSTRGGVNANGPWVEYGCDAEYDCQLVAVGIDGSEDAGGPLTMGEVERIRRWFLLDPDGSVRDAAGRQVGDE